MSDSKQQEGSESVPEKSVADDSGTPEATPASGPAPSEELQLAVEKAKAEAAQWQDKCLRTAADLDNFRRRMQREREENLKFGAMAFLDSLLPAFDNLELGLQSARQHHPEAKGVVDGLGMVLTQIQGILGEHGVEILDPVNQPFDPNQHDAVAHESSEDVPENQILAVQRKGYQLHGRLVRPAAVVVSSGPEKPAEVTAAQEEEK